MGFGNGMAIGWPNATSGRNNPIPNMSLYVTPTTNIDIPAYTGGVDSDFTIEWFAKMTADDNHPRAWSIGNFYEGANAAVSIENGTFYFWINGSIVLFKDISGAHYLGDWTWFMLQRFKSKVILYINGQSIDFAEFTDAITSNGKPLYIASEGVDSLQNGLMSNFRWTVGTTAYTPPEQGFYPIPTDPLFSSDPTIKLSVLQGNTLEKELEDQSLYGNILVNGTGILNADNPFVGWSGSLQFGTI